MDEVEKSDRMEHRDRCAARDLRDAAEVAGSDDAGRGLHDIRDLAVARPQGVAEPSDALPLLESSLEDIQIYFHIPVVTRAETVARNDPILIDDAHALETRSAPYPDSSRRKKCELVVTASDQRVDAVVPAATVTMTDAVPTATVTMKVRSIASHHLD
jgi:hypothetical protein